MQLNQENVRIGNVVMWGCWGPSRRVGQIESISDDRNSVVVRLFQDPQPQNDYEIYLGKGGRLIAAWSDIRVSFVNTPTGYHNGTSKLFLACMSGTTYLT